MCLQNCIKLNSPLITCPSCRIEVIVPREGVGALPTNIVLQAFLESIKSGTAGSPTSSIRKAQQDPAKTVTDTSKKGSCCKCSEPPLSDPCRHCYQVNIIGLSFFLLDGINVNFYYFNVLGRRMTQVLKTQFEFIFFFSSFARAAI